MIVYSYTNRDLGTHRLSQVPLETVYKNKTQKKSNHIKSVAAKASSTKKKNIKLKTLRKENKVFLKELGFELIEKNGQ